MLLYLRCNTGALPMRDFSEVLASLQAFRSKFEVLAAARKKAAPARGAPDRRPTRLRELTGFGANPVNLRMFAYAPEDLLPKRSISAVSDSVPTTCGPKARSATMPSR